MWICLILCLCPLWSRPAPAETHVGFRRALFSVLHDELDRTLPTNSNELFARLSAGTGMDEAEIRKRIAGLLDTLDRHSRTRSRSWRRLIRQGGPDVPPAPADRLLRQLIKEARGMLRRKGNYLLDSGIERASRKARLPAFLGRAFVVRLLERSLADSTGGTEGVGIVVGGHTNHFEINVDPLFLFFDSTDESYVREQVREIQRFIVPVLVRKLPESSAVRWAVRRREANPLIEPRYHLEFGVDGLHFSGSNFDLRPCIEATVELRDERSGAEVVKRRLEFCTARNGSKTTHSLAPFYEEVGDQVRAMIDEFLSR